MMKLRFLAVLVMALLLLGGTALAENVIPTIEMTLSQQQFDRPGEVTVNICLTNTGEQDMPGPCALYAPDGRRIEEFGTPTLAAGESAEWTGTWMVTAEQLAQGRIVFAMMYAATDASGGLAMKTVTFYQPILMANAARPELALTVAADQTELADFPGLVTFTVSVSNVGDADANVVDVYVADMKLHRFDCIPAGETVSFSRQVLVTSAGSYFFEADVGGETQQRYATSCIMEITAAEAEAAPVEEAAPAEESAPVRQYPLWTLLLLMAALIAG